MIKLFGREGRSLDDFKEITEDLQKVGFKANFISGLMMPFLNGLSDLTYLIVAVLGGLQVLAGRLTIGNMQAFVQYVWQINQPIQNLTQLAGQLQSKVGNDKPASMTKGGQNLRNELFSFYYPSF